MITKKEIPIITLIIAIITFSLLLGLNLVENWTTILTAFLAVSLVILLNISIKKLTAYKLDSEIEMRIWEVGRFGKNKKSFLIGAFLPIISKIILFPLTGFVWMASLVFDVKPKTYRAAKRFGLYSFSSVTEYEMGLIAASGILINILSAIVGYFLGFPLFARLSIYYAFFNILPISELDGNKIFFGSKVMWSFLASLILVGMLFAIFII